MTRPVKVFEWSCERHKPSERILVGPGKFHQFGTYCTENEINIGTVTSVIVEMPDGKVLNIEVELIQFTDNSDAP